MSNEMIRSIRHFHTKKEGEKTNTWHHNNPKIRENTVIVNKTNWKYFFVHDQITCRPLFQHRR